MLLDEYFQNCMYFSSNLLNRAITRMAEETFQSTGLSPTYAFLLMAAQEKPGLTQRELAEALHVVPSTITRFIEKLVHKGLVITHSEGRHSRVELTDKGEDLMPEIRKAWKQLAADYSEILGREEGKSITKAMYEVGRKLEDRL